MKSSFVFTALTVLVLTLTASVLLASADMKDGFEYSSLADMRAKWNISPTGFDPKVRIELSTKNVKEGKKALALSFPATAPVSNGRIDLIVTPDIPLKQVKQIDFWLYIDNPMSITQTGIYCTHPDLGGAFVRFGYVGLVKGWQKVSVSVDSLTVTEGNASWDLATKMQLTFWFAGGSPATKIMLDAITWGTTRERDRKLNKDWWDD